MCATCGHQVSVTAGTIFQDTRTPLTLWFRAIWWLVSQKPGASALHVLGLGSYRTAWTWLHKLRRAMVPRPGPPDRRGGSRRNVRWRRRARWKKALVAVAAEVRGPAIGRIRLRRVSHSSADSLLPFVQAAVTPGTIVITDGLQSYRGLPDVGYRHDRDE